MHDHTAIPASTDFRTRDRGDAPSSSNAASLGPVVRLVRDIVDAPVVLLEVRSKDSGRCLSGLGLHGKDLRDLSRWCRRALASRTYVEISGAALEEKIEGHSLFRDHTGIRFFAAAGIRDRSGRGSAALYVFDEKPRSFSKRQREALADLAALALTQILAEEAPVLLAQAQAAAAGLQQDLYQAERRHVSVLSALHEVVWETDVRGQLTRLSPPWTALTHCPVEASLGAPFSELFHPDDQYLFRTYFDHVSRNSEESPRLLIRYRKADGGYSWAELRAQRLIDEAGFACGFRGTLLDISDRKQIEAALDLSESRFRAIFERAAIGILFILPDGRALTANPAALRMLGCSELELKARSIIEFMPDHARDEWGVKLTELLSGSREALTFGSRFLRRSGVQVEVDVQANAVRDEMGRPLFAVLLLKDVTQAKRAEEELVEAKQRAEEVAAFKSSLLDNINHELRTPLATILGFASILIAEVSDDQREFIGLIQKAGERLTDTLNGVMDLARLESGTLAAQNELLHIQEEVQDVIIKMTPSAQEKGLELSVNCPAEPLYVTGDRGFLHRVIKNLIGNAIKFTAAGIVNVRLEAEPGEICVHVQDTGTGMSEDFLSILFQEFRQESAGIARAHEGVGLGLSIAKRLVERMEGRISVASAKGVGSTFTVHLPRVTSA